MNPIYKEYIEFLNNKGVQLDIQEGYYWLDRQIIKAFDMNGNIHKLYRLSIDEDLNVSYKKYATKLFDIASWSDIIELNKKRLEDIEIAAINKINTYSSKWGGV